MPFSPYMSMVSCMKYVLKTTVLFALLLIIGCADENPLLVNPPDGTDSMFVRVLNLAEDGASRQLRFGANSISNPTDYGNLSAVFRAPGDSATVFTLSSGTEKFRSYKKVTFTRTNYHTFFILPVIDKNRSKRQDTTLFYTTQARRILTTRNPELRMVNCYPDSNYTFEVRLGCQNGEQLLRDNGYLSFSGTREIESSTAYAVTVVKTQTTTKHQEIVGLYSFNAAEYASYCFVVYKTNNNAVGCGLIDDRNQSSGAFTQLIIQPEKQAFVRLINLTKETSSLSKIVENQSVNLESNVSPDVVSSFKEVGACSSNAVDSFIVEYSGGLKKSLTFPLQVQRNYTIIAADSLNKSGQNLTVLPLLSSTSIKEGNSRIYVVNMINDQPDVTVSLGARNTSKGLMSGEVLASRVGFSSMSSSADIPSGYLPITVFTTKQPAQLYATFIGNVAANTTYYLLLWNNALDNTIKAALLPINDSGQNLTLLEKGAFITFVHANNTKSAMDFTVNGTVNNIPLEFRSSTGTVIPAGNHTITCSEASSSINVSPDSNYIAFLSSYNGGSLFHVFSSAKRTTFYGQARRRCINLTEDVASFSVNEGATATDGIIATSVEQNKFFDTQPVFVERRLLLTFWNSGTKVTEMTGLLPLGRNYSIIVGGKSGSYFSLVQQEF